MPLGLQEKYGTQKDIRSTWSTEHVWCLLLKALVC